MILLNLTLLRQRLWKGKENIIILGIVAFLLMGFWGLYSMPADENGKMVSCPFISDLSGFCQMSLNEHVSLWQQIFSITKLKELFLLPLYLFAVFFILFSIIRKTYCKLKSQPFYSYLYEHAPEIKVFDRALLAFSEGIIHSKIYA